MAPTAGELIREARRRSGMSQAELARRAGVSQPVVSAYERGHREPGLETLRKLVEASGHDMEIGLEPRADGPRGLPDTPRGRSLRRHRKALIEMAARHDASNVRVFGSVARGDDSSGSDVDLLVDLGPRVGLLSLIGLEVEMEELLGVDVDLIPASGLKPGVRDRVLAEAIPL